MECRIWHVYVGFDDLSASRIETNIALPAPEGGCFCHFRAKSKGRTVRLI